jgi:uncharacterized membrane protein YbhN (UPF0104 family)
MATGRSVPTPRCAGVGRGGCEDEQVQQESPMSTSTTPVRRSRRRLVNRLLHLLVTVAALAVAGGVLHAKWGEVAGAETYFEHLHYVWVVVGAGFEILAIVAFAALQRRLLKAGGVSAGLVPLTGVTFAGNALQNSLPGGFAFAGVYAFRQFRRFGADDVLAGWMLFAITVLSGVALAIIAGLGLALAEGNAATEDLVGAIVGVMVLALGLAVLVRRGSLRTVVAGTIRVSQRLTGRPRGRAEAVLARTEPRLAAVSPSRTDWAVGLGHATANWGWDCACLGASFLAVGTHVPWRGLILAYGAAQLAANLPITPGGLGVVEGSLTIALVAYGGGRASTVAAVLMYRLMSFWGLLLIGWSTMGVLAFIHARRDKRAADLAPELIPEVPS